MLIDKAILTIDITKSESLLRGSVIIQERRVIR
jgi:hypothetical protein